MNRAYSVIDFRAVDDEKRIIEGIASTPEIDSYNTILEPEGAQYTLPMPVLYQHQAKQPIGHVTSVKVTKDQIRVRMQLAQAGVAGFIDEAWSLIRAGLVRGLSVGFDPIEETFDKTFQGIRYLKWRWLETSAVTIGANSSASITSVRSADEAILAALGTKTRSVVRLTPVNSPGVSGQTKGFPMKETFRDEIAAAEAKIAANDARQNEIAKRCKDTGETRTAEEATECENLETEIGQLTEHIKFLKAREARAVANGTVVQTPAAPNGNPEQQGEQIRRSEPITVRRNEPQGIGVARMAIAMVRANNNPELAAQMARKYWPGAPEVELCLRAVIEAGDTTTSGWASQLVPAAQQMNDQFLELFRPQTIIGKIPARNVPFNISVPIETASGTVAWVGEGAPKPVTKLTLSSVTLRWAKAAAIVVITKELAKFSRPDAEMVVRDSMVKTLVRFFDAQFVGSAAEVSNVSPAGILNGKSATAVTGATAANFRSDMNTMLSTMTAASVPLDNVVLLMSATQAVALSLAVTDLGIPLFPNIDRSGGTLLGFPVIISEAVGTKIIALNASDVLLAADPAVSVDVSDTASVEMDSAPAGGETSPVTDVSTLKSFWQNNLIGIRVEQFITWKLARAASVEFLSPVAYVP